MVQYEIRNVVGQAIINSSVRKTAVIQKKTTNTTQNGIVLHNSETLKKMRMYTSTLEGI